MKLCRYVRPRMKHVSFYFPDKGIPSSVATVRCVMRDLGARDHGKATCDLPLQCPTKGFLGFLKP